MYSRDEVQQFYTEALIYIEICWLCGKLNLKSDDTYNTILEKYRKMYPEAVNEDLQTKFNSR
jgi:hypothetical protein